MKEKDYYYNEEEIAVFDILWVILKRLYLIIPIVVITVGLTFLYSKPPPKVYQSKSIIQPTEGFQAKGGGSSQLMGTFGGFADLMGSSMPTKNEPNDIMIWYNSNTLKEVVIKKFNLLPIIFPGLWNSEKGEWKKAKKKINDPEPKQVSFLQRIKQKIMNYNDPEPEKGFRKKREKPMEDGPSVWDGVKKLNGILKIENGEVEGTFAAIAEYYDPEVACLVVDKYLMVLNEHLSNEAKRTAEINWRFLENQLKKTTDPIVRNKISNMIAQEIETVMFSDAKENFGFKIIDPPRVPEKPMSPKKKHTLPISFVASLFFGIFLALFLEHRRKRKGIKN